MLLARFLRSREAGVMPLLALSMVPIMAALAGAVDYGHASSVRTSMQTALDSAALMLSKDAQSLTGDQLNQKAKDYFTALFVRPDALNVQVTAALASPQQRSFELTLNGSATVNTTFARTIGHTQIAISAKSEVRWGIKKLELALALDNTGSMTGGKIVELKKAVHGLLDKLEKTAKDPEDIKVAIVPFDTSVRVDQDHKSVAWWVTLDYLDKNDETWIGCLMDRDQSSDVTDTPPLNGSKSTLYPATPCSNNGALVKLRPLTNNWKDLRLTVNGMNPNGRTNITIGLAWAWHALTPNLPLTEASAPQPDRDKVVILLTDGQNTQNRWTTSTTAIDARTQKVCDNIKAADIRIYTIRVIDGNASLLRSCATNPDMYYEVQQADQLSGVFSSITQNLSNLRIAK